MQSWAHARRKFFEVAKHGNTPTATGALERINALFDIERIATEENLSPEERQIRRIEQAKPKLDALAEFIKTEQQQLLPNTPTMAAIGYVQNHWQALTRYLDDGHCVIDNNAAERALRVVAVGRKNWLFAGSENGGHAASIFGRCSRRGPTSSIHGVVYTLIESAKANGHNPRVYLEDILGNRSCIALPPPSMASSDACPPPSTKTSTPCSRIAGPRPPKPQPLQHSPRLPGRWSRPDAYSLEQEELAAILPRQAPKRASPLLRRGVSLQFGKHSMLENTR